MLQRYRMEAVKKTLATTPPVDWRLTFIRKWFPVVMDNFERKKAWLNNTDYSLDYIFDTEVRRSHDLVLKSVIEL